MIAYDFDGVFVPDCDQIEIDGLDQTEFFGRVVYAMRPIFVPQHRYTVITSRHTNFTSLTMSWFFKHMNRNMPQALYHENLNVKEPALYKAEVINQIRPTVYVESDPSVVEALQRLTNTRIVLFSDYVSEYMSLLQHNK